MSAGAATDLYELTMAASYLRHGMDAVATFSLFVRRLPPQRGFLVAAGLEDAIRLLEDFAFDESDLEWLTEQGFAPGTLEAFRELRFTGDVWAVPEGQVIFANEPLLEVTAPLPEAQLVETMLLNQLTYQTALATKAARCQLAAAGRATLVDFSLRRTQGMEAGMHAARAAIMAGFAGTSNVGAARQLGVPAIGTMAHSYIEAFPDEHAAFSTFAGDFPERATFLVDTYDTLRGVETAVEVISHLTLDAPIGIRLDSGDLLQLSRESRRLLDAAGRPDVVIVASGGLDEFAVQQLLDDGAPIDIFGLGTRVGVSADAPSLDSAYKLVEYAGLPMMKLSPGKETLPLPKQVYRTRIGESDLLASRDEQPPRKGRPLLGHVMSGGRRTSPPEPIEVIRDRLLADLAELPTALRDLQAHPPPPVTTSAALQQVTDALIQTHRHDSER